MTNAQTTAGRPRRRLGPVSETFGVLIILSVMLIALAYVILAISVNAGRISHLQRIEATIQSLASQIARDPHSTEIQTLQDQLKQNNNERDSQLGEIEYGNYKFWGLPFWTCAFPSSADCLHKNASETNNLYLSLASGLLGASLYLLLGIYLQVSAQAPSNISYNLRAVTAFLPLGMMVGIATLTAIRGTKGALVAPVANVVQLDNPYGIAFITTLAAYASVRILTLASGLVDSIPNLWKAGTSPDATQKTPAPPALAPAPLRTPTPIPAPTPTPVPAPIPPTPALPGAIK
jgi:hypothetical protein